MNTDLTIGRPEKILWKFCLPLFGSVIFQQLYNLADSFVAGKFINQDALAAVGNSYEITLIFLAFSFGCNMGCSIIVSQLFGAKKYGELKTAVYTSLISAGVLCLMLMVIGWRCSTNLLELINTPSNVFYDSELYLKIYILGLPFVFFYNVATGIFSALGDSKTPFIFLACSSTANIAMDILFVKAFNIGVAGVAWATFICQGVSCILAIIFVFMRFRNIETAEPVVIFSWRILGRIAVVAIPSILQQSSISIGNIIVQGIINSFGSSVMAGYSASIKLNNLAISSFITIGNGISNYTAQNFGAEKPKRVCMGFPAGLKIVFSLAVPFALLYFFLGKHLVYIFMDSPTGTAIDVGTVFLKIASPFYPVVAAKLVSDGVLRGTGRMGRFMVGTFADLVIRVILAYLLSAPYGSTGIWMAWPIGWTVSTVISIFFYKTGPWHKAAALTGEE